MARSRLVLGIATSCFTQVVSSKLREQTAKHTKKNFLSCLHCMVLFYHWPHRLIGYHSLDEEANAICAIGYNYWLFLVCILPWNTAIGIVSSYTMKWCKRYGLFGYCQSSLVFFHFSFQVFVSSYIVCVLFQAFVICYIVCFYSFLFSFSFLSGNIKVNSLTWLTSYWQ